MNHSEMLDKVFLYNLEAGKIVWTRKSIEIARRLSIDGYVEYKTSLHAGWWEITDKGREFIWK